LHSSLVSRKDESTILYGAGAKGQSPSEGNM
jgi:hypothetical protein